MLARMPDATAVSALAAFTLKFRSIAEPMRLSLTYDQGKETMRHKELAAATGLRAVVLRSPQPVAEAHLQEH